MRRSNDRVQLPRCCPQRCYSTTIPLSQRPVNGTAVRDRRIDIAGPRPDAAGPYPYRDLLPLVRQAREAGFGVTIHVGEEGGEYGIAEIREVVSSLRPDRIGHGILAAQDEKLMTQIGEAEIVLEICPTSNLLTKALPDEAAVRDTFRAFSEHGVRSRSRPTARR